MWPFVIKSKYLHKTTRAACLQPTGKCHPPSFSPSSVCSVPPGQLPVPKADLPPTLTAEAHRAADSISDKKNIRAARGGNAMMPIDFI